MSILWSVPVALAAVWLGRNFKTVFAADYGNDPVYKKNVQALIERNRQFEETKE